MPAQLPKTNETLYKELAAEYSTLFQKINAFFENQKVYLQLEDDFLNIFNILNNDAFSPRRNTYKNDYLLGKKIEPLQAHIEFMKNLIALQEAAQTINTNTTNTKDTALYNASLGLWSQSTVLAQHFSYRYINHGYYYSSYSSYYKLNPFQQLAGFSDIIKAAAEVISKPSPESMYSFAKAAKRIHSLVTPRNNPVVQGMLAALELFGAVVALTAAVLFPIVFPPLGIIAAFPLGILAGLMIAQGVFDIFTACEAPVKTQAQKNLAISHGDTAKELDSFTRVAKQSFFAAKAKTPSRGEPSSQPTKSFAYYR